MSTEREFIRNLQRRFVAGHPVLTGIGDDGAVLDTSTSDRQVVVTDMLLDGVHFRLSEISPAIAGRKAITVNLSDLAAMGCRPTAAFVSIAVPRDCVDRESFLLELYNGIRQTSEQFNFTIAGGDTNQWDGPFAINVCLTGVPFHDAAVLRATAVPGDVLYTTGPLGGSLASGRHLTFEPRLDAARWITESLNVHAMMDISDGLALDLHRMMEASGTGAVIEEERIPIHTDVPDVLSKPERLQRALSDGEDFELLVALAPEKSQTLATALNDGTLTHIGRVTDNRSVIALKALDGSIAPLSDSGWQHS